MSKEFYFIIYEEDCDEYCNMVKKSDNFEKIKEYAELIKQSNNDLVAILKGEFIWGNYIEDLKEEDFTFLKEQIQYEIDYQKRLKEFYKRIKEEREKKINGKI